MSVRHKINKSLIFDNIRKDSNGCWIWQGNFANGYPRVQIDNVFYQVTRLSLHLFRNFDLSSELDACHKEDICKSKKCINPEHLYEGTRSVNMQDYHNSKNSRRWNEEKTHCKQGHEFTPINTYLYLGKRQCKLCKSNRQKLSLKRKIS